MSNSTVTLPDRARSIALQEKGKKLIPGLSQLLSKRPDQFAPGVWPGYFSKASGVEVWDVDGNKYVDMSIGGIGANVLGYGDPDVDAAVRAAIDGGTSCSLMCPEEVELAELLCQLHPWSQMVRFARTGGEAMAVAVRIARAHTGRDKVAFCGYHGWHDWYLSANLGTENALGEHLLSGLDPRGVPKGLQGTALPFRYNHPEELEAIISEHRDDLAAVIMEPIRGEQPRDGFLNRVIDMARQCGAVSVIDEISAALRMNTGGAHLMFEVEPDIAVFSKALGNGYPIAAIVGRSEVMEAAQTTFISSTYWTERIGPSAAIATINKHQQIDAGPHLMSIGEKVQAGWRRVADQTGLAINIGGIPPLSHFSFEGNDAMEVKALFVQMMLAEGFLASTSFYSMAPHTNEHVEQYLAAVKRTFAEITDLRGRGEVASNLLGSPAVAGFKRLA